MCQLSHHLAWISRPRAALPWPPPPPPPQLHSTRPRAHTLITRSWEPAPGTSCSGSSILISILSEYFRCQRFPFKFNTPKMLLLLCPSLCRKLLLLLISWCKNLYRILANQMLKQVVPSLTNYVELGCLSSICLYCKRSVISDGPQDEVLIPFKI